MWRLRTICSWGWWQRIIFIISLANVATSKVVSEETKVSFEPENDAETEYQSIPKRKKRRKTVLQNLRKSDPKNCNKDDTRTRNVGKINWINNCGERDPSWTQIYSIYHISINKNRQKELAKITEQYTSAGWYLGASRESIRLPRIPDDFPCGKYYSRKLP